MAKAKKPQNRPHSNVHLSPPHPYTVINRTNQLIPAQPNALLVSSFDDMDADDDNICPVCESECTCSNNASAIPPLPPTPPPSMPLPKIKLTLSARPPNRKPPAKTSTQPDGTSSLTSDPDTPLVRMPPPPARKRGRPLKSVVMAREAAAKAAAQLNSGRPVVRKKIPAKRGPGRPPKNKKLFTTAPPPLTSSGSDSDSDVSGRFPTFISAPPSSASSSDTDSSDSSSSSSLSDDDDSIVDEEEQLIVAESYAHQKARVARELLGDNANNNNGGSRKWDQMNWGSMPRYGSVDGEQVDSGVETDDDTDGAGDEEDSDEDADAEPDGDAERDLALAGWSDENDEECDADFFFANLSDSSFALSSDDEAMQDSVLTLNSIDDRDESVSNAGTVESGFLASFSSAHIGSANRGRKLRRSPPLPLVVAQDLDGNLVFGHGLKDDEPLMDFGDVPASAGLMDVDDQTETEDEPGVEWEVESDADGNTTAEDEPLTMDDEMSLPFIHLLPPKPAYPSLSAFRFPTPPPPSVDPKSTFSSPVHSPGARLSRSMDLPEAYALSSPKPADILAGRNSIFWDSQASTLTERSQDLASSFGSLRSESPRRPTMGIFALPGIGNPKLSAIIKPQSPASVPCPFSHLRRKNSRGRKRVSHGRSDIYIRVAQRGRDPSTPRPQSMDSYTGSGSLASPSDSISDVFYTTPERTLSHSMELDDVLDASAIHEHEEWGGIRSPESSAEASSFTTPDANARNLSRWSRVPMGTFRRSRAVTWAGDHVLANANSSPGVLIVGVGTSGARMPIPVSDGFSYGATSGPAMRSPYENPTLWDSTLKSRLGAQTTPTAILATRGRRGKSDRKVLISPIIFPVQDNTPNERYEPIDSPPPTPRSYVSTPKHRTSTRPSRSNSNVSTLTVPPLDLDA